MLLSKSILTGGVENERSVFPFIFGNHTLAAARITGYGVTGYKSISRENASINQRLYKCDKSACVATGNCYSVCSFNLFEAIFKYLRKTVNPLLTCTVGSGSIEYSYIIINFLFGTYVYYNKSVLDIFYFTMLSQLVLNV